VEEIREVPHFENGVEHKILITYVIAKVSAYVFQCKSNVGICFAEGIYERSSWLCNLKV